MPKKNDTALVECMGKEKYKDMQSLKSAAICKFNEAVKILKKADKCLGISDTEERESETLQAIIKNTEEYIDDLRD